MIIIKQIITENSEILFIVLSLSLSLSFVLIFPFLFSGSFFLFLQLYLLQFNLSQISSNQTLFNKIGLPVSGLLPPGTVKAAAKATPVISVATTM